MRGSTNSQQKQNALLLDNSVQTIPNTKRHATPLYVMTGIPSVTTQSIQWGAGDFCFLAQDGTEIMYFRVQQEGSNRLVYLGLADTTGQVHWTLLASA